MKKLAAIIAATSLASTGCTSMIIGMMVPTMKDLASVGFEKTDLDFMGAAMPASLLQLEGMHLLAPKNEELAMLIAESKCGYALGWVEDENPKLASKYYMEGKELALLALSGLSKEYRKTVEAGGTIQDGINAITDDDELIIHALFTLGNCWGNWLNVNMTNPRALFAVPAIVAAMGKVKDMSPGYFYGSAELFFGSYYTMIPAIAGGGLEKGRKYFEEAFAASDEKMLLVHFYMAKAYAGMLKDLEDPVSGKTGEEIFDEMIAYIENFDSDSFPELALVNSMAKKKASILKAKKDQIF